MDTYPVLRKVDFNDLSKLTCEFFLGEIRSKPNHRILVIRFAGEYRSGGAGAPDASSMLAMLHAGYEAWDCWGLIIDLSGFVYTWGYDIEPLLCMPLPSRWAARWTEEKYPRALIVGPGCEQALASLYYDCNVEKTSFSEPWVFRDFAAGREYIEQQIRNS